MVLANKYSAKILIIGEAGSGKTSLSQRYVDNVFDEIGSMTIGVDFRVKTIDFVDSVNEKREKLTLNIWDTAGQERFNSIVAGFYRNVNGIIVTFDMTNNESFEMVVSRWLPQLSNWCPETPIVLVGNKIEKIVTLTLKETPLYIKASTLAMEQNIPFVLCSAKTGEGVYQVFKTLIQLIVDSNGFDGLERKHSGHFIVQNADAEIEVAINSDQKWFSTGCSRLPTCNI